MSKLPLPLCKASSLLLLLISLVTVEVVSAYAHEDDASSGKRSKYIIKVTPQGLQPPQITLDHLDGSVFIYNDTQNDLITFEIEWGKRSAHCASQNLQLTEAGILRTVRPIAPGDFGLACFPQTGTYPVRVYGLHGDDSPLNAQVIVTR
jgi:hypothetical protein